MSGFLNRQGRLFGVSSLRPSVRRLSRQTPWRQHGLILPKPSALLSLNRVSTRLMNDAAVSPASCSTLDMENQAVCDPSLVGKTGAEILVETIKRQGVKVICT